MKYILLLASILYLSGCTTATNYTEREKELNQGQPPKMLFGILKVYPGASAALLKQSFENYPTSLPPSRSTYINTTTTVKSSNGTTTTYTTKGYVR